MSEEPSALMARLREAEAKIRCRLAWAYAVRLWARDPAKSQIERIMDEQREQLFSQGNGEGL